MYKLILLLLICIVIGGLSADTASAAPAPSGFGDYTTWGLGLTPEFASGQQAYTMTLWSGAYVYANGIEYPITDIWGVYAVNKTEDNANDFLAAGSNVGEWVWSQNPQHGSSLNVGGWQNSSKKESLQPPATGSASMEFVFDQLSFTGAAPTLGLHVSVSVPDGGSSPFPGGGVTSSIIPSAVPEPSSLSAILAGILGVGGLALRRRK